MQGNKSTKLQWLTECYRISEKKKNRTLKARQKITKEFKRQ